MRKRIFVIIFLLFAVAFLVSMGWAFYNLLSKLQPIPSPDTTQKASTEYKTITKKKGTIFGSVEDIQKADTGFVLFINSKEEGRLSCFVGVGAFVVCQNQVDHTRLELKTKEVADWYKEKLKEKPESFVAAIGISGNVVREVILLVTKEGDE